MFKFKIVLVFLMLLFGSFSAWAQQEPATDVSDEDLSKFAAAFVEVQNIDQEVQQNMVAAVEEAGMDVDRYNEIQQMQQDPEQKLKATDEEKKMFVQATQQVQELRVQAQMEMRAKIEESGLTVESYGQIVQAVQQSAELQQKLQKILEKGR